MRTLLTQSLAVLMSFYVQELNDSTGNYYGINQISKNANFVTGYTFSFCESRFFVVLYKRIFERRKWMIGVGLP